MAKDTDGGLTWTTGPTVRKVRRVMAAHFPEELARIEARAADPDAPEPVRVGLHRAVYRIFLATYSGATKPG